MESGVILCNNCRHRNEVAREICEECGSPIGSWTSPSQIDGVLSGNFHHQAVATPRKFVIVLGVWLVFLPSVLVALWLTIVFLSQQSFIMAFMFACIAVWPIAVLRRTTKNYIEYKKNETASATD